MQGSTFCLVVIYSESQLLVLSDSEGKRSRSRSMVSVTADFLMDKVTSRKYSKQSNDEHVEDDQV